MLETRPNGCFQADQQRIGIDWNVCITHALLRCPVLSFRERGKVRTGKSVPKSKVSVFALLRCERTVCVAIKRVRRVILTSECVMKSLVIKRSVVLSGHKTSISRLLKKYFCEGIGV